MGRQTTTYGFNEDADVRVEDYQQIGPQSTCCAGQEPMRVTLNAEGSCRKSRHNEAIYALGTERRSHTVRRSCGCHTDASCWLRIMSISLMARLFTLIHGASRTGRRQILISSVKIPAFSWSQWMKPQQCEEQHDYATTRRVEAINSARAGRVNGKKSMKCCFNRTILPTYAVACMMYFANV